MGPGQSCQLGCRLGPSDASPAGPAPTGALSDVSIRARGHCGQTVPVILRVGPGPPAGRDAAEADSARTGRGLPSRTRDSDLH